MSKEYFRPNPKPEPREKKKRKRIPPVSERKKHELKVYKEVRHEYLLLHTYCERCLWLMENKSINHNVNIANQIHHKSGRIGALLVDTEYFMACCDTCHRYIEDNPLESLKTGWSLKRVR